MRKQKVLFKELFVAKDAVEGGLGVDLERERPEFWVFWEFTGLDLMFPGILKAPEVSKAFKKLKIDLSS